jgi:hypothetical protein
VTLSNGLELAFPPHLAEGLAAAKPADLAVIEVTPAGLGLHWSKLDADLYLPALLQGVFGSPRWMAGLLGRNGGLARTEAKGAASAVSIVAIFAHRTIEGAGSPATPVSAISMSPAHRRCDALVIISTQQSAGAPALGIPRHDKGGTVLPDRAIGVRERNLDDVPEVKACHRPVYRRRCPTRRMYRTGRRSPHSS